MRAILAILLLISGITYADGPYTRSRVLGGSGSGASATPGGVSGSVQYNANGAFGGDTGLTYNNGGLTASPNSASVPAFLASPTVQVGSFLGMEGSRDFCMHEAGPSGANTQLGFKSVVSANDCSVAPVADKGMLFNFPGTRGSNFVGKLGVGPSNFTPGTDLEVRGQIWANGIISGSAGVNTTTVTATEVNVSGNVSSTRFIARPNGNPSSVDYQFLGDADTGLYSNGPNVAIIAVGGQNAMLADGTRIVLNKNTSIGGIGGIPTGSLMVSGSTIFGSNILAGNTPSATLHVSGTTIPGICNASITCGSAQAGAMCFGTTRNTFYACNGANSWVPLVSTTIVSASGSM